MTFDPSIYDHVPASLQEDDKRALLATLDAVRRARGAYCYLEIGSFRGGSLQPVVADPACIRAYSFDARQGGPPYTGMNAARMMANLSRVPGADTSKLVCYTMDTRDATPPREYVPTPPDACFIDAWHTPPEAQKDWRFCMHVAGWPVAVLWHDIDMIAPAFRDAATWPGVTMACRLSSKVGLIYLGDWEAFATPELRAMVQPLRWRALQGWWAVQRRWRKAVPQPVREALAPMTRKVRARLLGS